MDTNKTPIFQRPVSAVRNIAKSANMGVFTLERFLSLAEYPKTLQYLQDARNNAMLRQAKGDLFDDAYKTIKTYNLQAVCVSGVFDGSIKEENIVSHSGLICIDIDAGDNPNVQDWEQAKRVICEYSCIAYCALSLSGKGLFCIIPIDAPCTVQIPGVDADKAERKKAIADVKDLHERQFKALQISFRDMGFEIDKACKNLNRLRVLSHDQNAYRNDDAETYTHIVPKPKQQTWDYTNRRMMYLSERRTTQQQNKYGSLVEWLDAHGVDYTRHGERYAVMCPWEHLHTTHTGTRQTCVFEQGGKWCFHCFHSHCADKTFKDYSRVITQQT